MAKVAKYGKLALLGRGGRRFKSCHPDHRQAQGETVLGPVQPRKSPVALAGVAGITAGLILPTQARPLALLWPVIVLVAVALPTRQRCGSGSRAALAMLVGLGPTLVILGATHDVLGITVPVPVSAIVAQLLWTVSSLSIGCDVARRITDRSSAIDVWSRIGAVGAVTMLMVTALGRLLLPRFGPAERLAWMLSEEDNAQIVGIAREVLDDGARGAALAEQFGTGFITLPLMIVRLAGGPIVGEGDIRLQAITLFVISTMVAAVIAGLAMALLSALPHHVHPGQVTRSGAHRMWPVSVVIGTSSAAIASLIGFSLLLVLPMRTGFLTFVWGLALVLLAASLAAITPRDASSGARVMLIVHLLATILLLLSSWPFIAPALAPVLLIPLLWIDWGRALQRAKAHPRRSLVLAAVLLGSLASSTIWFLRWGPAAEVLSYGTGILTVGGSGIYADALLPRVVVLTLAFFIPTILLGSAAGTRATQLLAIVGPVVGAGLLYLALRAAAALLTDGELGYSGVKLFYGLITLGLVLGLTALVSQAARFGLPAVLATLLLIGTVHQMSPTANLHTEWRTSTLLSGALHAEAAVDAIRSSTDLPIRCLPSPGTVVTDRTRWAAYFCARWMEDAFNPGRFDGRRFELLAADGPTFEQTIETIVAENQSEYLFAYRMTMGRGWFGWDGSAD